MQVAERKKGDLLPTYDIGLGLSNSGEDVMKGLDSIVRLFVLGQGTGLRWLRDELDALHVSIPLTDGCLSELVRDADTAIRRVGAKKGQNSCAPSSPAARPSFNAGRVRMKTCLNGTKKVFRLL
jgi:hypothetical protein